jgi:outer membrane protein assembly factor BamD (BamD/ComL family)
MCCGPSPAAVRSTPLSDSGDSAYEKTNEQDKANLLYQKILEELDGTDASKEAEKALEEINKKNAEKEKENTEEE